LIVAGPPSLSRRVSLNTKGLLSVTPLAVAPAEIKTVFALSAIGPITKVAPEVGSPIIPHALSLLISL
jgi:hypothetical protein